MTRPVWNGSISFGLLNVPVQIFSGERSVDLHFRLLDSRDQKPIRYERVNSDTRKSRGRMSSRRLNMRKATMSSSRSRSCARRRPR
jgi:non-homologous end joining protein Ku